MKRTREPAGSMPPTVPDPRLDANGIVHVPSPSDSFENEETPFGGDPLADVLHRIYVALDRMSSRQRDTQPVIVESVEASAARDRSRAAAWEALGGLLRSRWAGAGGLVLVGAISLAGLDLVGVDLGAIPAIVAAVRGAQCPP